MKQKMDNNYIKWGLTILAVIVTSIVFFFLLLRWRNIFEGIFNVLKIFTPFLVGFIIAYLLNPLLKVLEKKFFDDLGRDIFNSESKALTFSRICSIVLSTLIVLAIIVGFCSYVIPEILKSFETIIVNIPTYLTSIEDFLINRFSDNEAQDYIRDNYDIISNYITNYLNSDSVLSINSLLGNISSGVLSIVKAIYNIVLGYIIAIYLLLGKEKFIGQGKKLLYTFVKPDKAYIIIDNLKYTDKIFGGFLLGKCIDSLIIGAICFVFMLLLKMPYPILLAVIIGITNIIPYFGPIIGAVPCALFILLISPAKFLTFIIFIIILQQFDGNILGPKILGDKTGLQSFWVLFAIIVFGGLFGFIGMLFGVPLFAIIYSFCNGLVSRKLSNNNLPLKTEDYIKIDYIDPNTNKPIYYKKEKATK